nr:embryo defective 2735 [Ipomoea batatas]
MFIKGVGVVNLLLLWKSNADNVKCQTLLHDDPLVVVHPESKDWNLDNYALWCWKEASRLYAASWVRDIGPLNSDLMTTKRKQYNEGHASLKKMLWLQEVGMETLRPALQRVYMTRASAYRECPQKLPLKDIKKVFQQVMEKKEEANKSQKKRMLDCLLVCLCGDQHYMQANGIFGEVSLGEVYFVFSSFSTSKRKLRKKA